MPPSYDFYALVAERIGSTKKNVEKVCNGIIDEIAAELYVRGRIYIPYLGTFYAYQVDEYFQKHIVDGEEKLYKVPEHIKPKFNPCDDFINHSNYAGVTKAYRRRARNKELTKRDVSYLKKSELAKKIAKMEKADVAKAKDDFAEFLAQRKENHYIIVNEENKDENEVNEQK